MNEAFHLSGVDKRASRTTAAFILKSGNNHCGGMIRTLTEGWRFEAGDTMESVLINTVPPEENSEYMCV